MIVERLIKIINPGYALDMYLSSTLLGSFDSVAGHFSNPLVGGHTHDSTAAHF